MFKTSYLNMIAGKNRETRRIIDTAYIGVMLVNQCCEFMNEWNHYELMFFIWNLEK